MRLSWIAAAAALSLLGSAALAQGPRYTAALTGADEVPPNDSQGKGSVAASYNPDTGELQWRIEYSGLSGDVTAAHFHGPADPGKNAAPVVPLSAPFSNPIQGKAKLSPEQAKMFADGKVYFNLHTAKYKDGEIRGQLKQTM